MNERQNPFNHLFQPIHDLLVRFCVCVWITQAMAYDWNGPIELWVPLFEESVQPVDLWSHSVHYGLTIGGAVIEKQVQQCVIGEVSEPADARQSDSLNVPGNVEGGQTEFDSGLQLLETQDVLHNKRLILSIVSYTYSSTPVASPCRALCQLTGRNSTFPTLPSCWACL